MAKVHAEITPEMIAGLKAHIGEEYQVPTRNLWNEYATKDTIKHFCDGIGDINPLSRDEEYAKRTKYGCIVAPLCFLYSVYWNAGMAVGMKGIHGWHSGNDWKGYKPILVGDKFTVTYVLTDVKEKESKYAGKIVWSYGDAYYKNHRGEIAAKSKGWCAWAGRAEAGATGKYANIPKATYTPEELKAIEDAVFAEEIRGAIPRYWEDVEVGEELTPVVNGPLTERDMIAWLQGASSPFMKAHRIYYEFTRRHPATEMIDTRTGKRDVPELVHMEDTRAQEIGLPGAYDYGHQRISWLGNLLTNWMGDDGFLVRLYAELRLFNVYEDTTWLKGKVTRKYVTEEGEPRVDIGCWGENQRGEITLPGRATVALPSQDRDYWPVEKRLPR